MKPGYESIMLLKFVDLGHRGVKRFLGNPIKVVEPGRAWSFLGLHDIAMVDVKPQSRDEILDVVSKDQQSFKIHPRMFYWVADPMKFLDRAPDDYERQLSEILKHQVDGEIPKTYNLVQLMDARFDLATHVEEQMNVYLQKQGWGVSVDVFIPDLDYPSVTPDEIEVRKIRAERAMPLLKQLKSLEAEVAGLEARKFAAEQREVAKGHAAYIKTVMSAKAAGLDKLAGAYRKLGEAVLAPYKGKLEPAYLAWILKDVAGMVAQSLNAQKEGGLGNIGTDMVGNNIEEMIASGLRGEGVAARAQKSGVSPTFTSVLDAAERAIPYFAKNATPAQVDELLRNKYGGNQRKT